MEQPLFAKVCEILDLNGRQPGRLIPILQQVQEEYRYLPEEILTFVATSLGLPPARVFGVATFYAHFTLKPKGKYTIRLCDGTACHVRQSTGILAGAFGREEHHARHALYRGDRFLSGRPRAGPGGRRQRRSPRADEP
jgi:NADH-quinone oxidoreductase subunit E